jgi:hypothetical protein
MSFWRRKLLISPWLTHSRLAQLQKPESKLIRLTPELWHICYGQTHVYPNGINGALAEYLDVYDDIVAKTEGTI